MTPLGETQALQGFYKTIEGNERQKTSKRFTGNLEKNSVGLALLTQQINNTLAKNTNAGDLQITPDKVIDILKGEPGKSIDI